MAGEGFHQYLPEMVVASDAEPVEFAHLIHSRAGLESMVCSPYGRNTLPATEIKF